MNILSLNLWDAGQNTQTSVDDYVDMIRKYKPDVICFQEAYHYENNVCRDNIGLKIGQVLNLHSCDQKSIDGYGNVILSRFPIIKSYSESNEIFAVELNICGQSCIIVNVHLTDVPCQFFQLYGLFYPQSPPLSKGSEHLAIKSAYDCRTRDFIHKIKSLIQLNQNCPILICGDFNEPSCQDWTSNAFVKKLYPYVIRWPTTLSLLELNFHDAFRTLYPDETLYPGHTWPNLCTKNENYTISQRIDYIFFRNCHVISVHQLATKYSDHALLLGQFTLPRVYF